MNDYENLKISIDKLINVIDKLNNKIDKAIEQKENKYCLAVPTTIRPRVRGVRVKMR